MISLRPKVGGAEVQLRSRHILYKSPVVRKIHHHHYHHHHNHIATSALLIIATQKPPRRRIVHPSRGNVSWLSNVVRQVTFYPANAVDIATVVEASTRGAHR